MIIAGAKGLAAELLEIFAERNALDSVYFFDNVSHDLPSHLHDQFPILRSFEEVQEIFLTTNDKNFCLGLGNPVLRHRLAQQFMDLGGVLTSVISPRASIGRFGTVVGAGCCVLPGAVITGNVIIGRGCLVNPNATVSHDSVLGDFAEISPGVNVTGNCTIGDFSFVGSNAVVLPKVKVGKNVIVAAGSVVRDNVPDNCMVAGAPAEIKKTLPALNSSQAS